MKAWEEQRPANFRPPAPLAILLAIVCRAMLFSERASDHHDKVTWRIFGALLLIGFFGLLRVKSADATLPNSWSLGGEFAVLKIDRPKNSRQMGVQQCVEVRHPDAVNWLAWLKSVRSPEAAFWSGGPNKFRSMFKCPWESRPSASLLHPCVQGVQHGWLMRVRKSTASDFGEDGHTFVL